MIEAYEVRTRDLPHNVKAEFMTEAQTMLHDLSINWLDVCLTPAPDPQHSGHMVRAVANRNPEWYRKYFGYSNRNGTTIEWYGTCNRVRRRVTAALERIAKAEDEVMSPFLKYRLHGILRAIIIERFEVGYISCEGVHVAPNSVAEFFNDKT